MSVSIMSLMATLGLDSREYEKGLSKAKDEVGKLSSAFSSAGSAIGGALKTAAKIGIEAITAATGAVVAFGATAVKTGMEFDSAMSGVAATMGKTMDEMQNEVGETDTSFGHFSGTLRDFAIFMGEKTAFSATEAAEALNFMALAGYETQESMEMLPAVLDMAAAGTMDLARASDMITDTQSALGLSFKRTNQMVDEFAKAASTGNTSVEQIGDAFLRVGGLAKELNGGLVALADGTEVSTDGVQELEIAFTAMANAGVKGTEAGTHMRNMLLSLSDPTDDGTKALEDMGVAIFDNEGKMRSLSNIFGDLNEQLSQMSQEQRIGIISDLFNTRDLASAESLLAAVEGEMVKIGDDVYSVGTAYEKWGDAIYDSTQGFEIIRSSWDEIGESILNAEGAAAQMAETKLDNLEGDITRFKSALESAQITISDQLSPSLREFVQFGTAGIQSLKAGFEEGGLSGAMNAFGTVLADGLTMIMDSLPDWVNAGTQLLGALGQGILDNLDIIIDAGIQILSILGEAFVNGLPQIIDAGLQILEALLSALTENMDEVLEGVGKLIAGISDAINSHASDILEMGASIVEMLFNAMMDNLPEVMTFITQLLSDFLTWISENASTIIEAATQIITTLASGLVSALPDLIPAVVDVILAIVDGLLDNIDKVIDAALKIIVALAEGVIKALPKLLEKAPIIMEKLVKAILDNLPKILETAAQLVINLAEGLINNIPKLVGAAVKMVVSLVEGIIGLKDRLKDSAHNIMESFKEGIMGFIDNAKDWGRDLVNNFVDGISGVIDRVRGVVSDIAETVRSYLHFSVPDVGPLKDFGSYAPDMMELFAKGIKDNENLVTNQIEKSFDFSDVIADQTVNVNDSGRGNVSYGGVTINVYGAEGQDINELADAVSYRLNHLMNVQGAVYA